MICMNINIVNAELNWSILWVSTTVNKNVNTSENNSCQWMKEAVVIMRYYFHTHWGHCMGQANERLQQLHRSFKGRGGMRSRSSSSGSRSRLYPSLINCSDISFCAAFWKRGKSNSSSLKKNNSVYQYLQPFVSLTHI